jgi:hypothetical protein
MELVKAHRHTHLTLALQVLNAVLSRSPWTKNVVDLERMAPPTKQKCTATTQKQEHNRRVCYVLPYYSTVTCLDPMWMNFCGVMALFISIRNKRERILQKTRLYWKWHYPALFEAR